MATGHNCGCECQRQQNTGARRDCPGRSLNPAGYTVTAGGLTLTLVGHARDGKHGITNEQIAYALDNWALRGLYTEPNGAQSWNYLAFVPALDKLVVVAVSMDNARIVTAYASRRAIEKWRTGDRAYFVRRYQQNLEARDGA